LYITSRFRRSLFIFCLNVFNLLHHCFATVLFLLCLCLLNRVLDASVSGFRDLGSSVFHFSNGDHSPPTSLDCKCPIASVFWRKGPWCVCLPSSIPVPRCCFHFLSLSCSRTRSPRFLRTLYIRPVLHHTRLGLGKILCSLGCRSF